MSGYDRVGKKDKSGNGMECEEGKGQVEEQARMAMKTIRTSEERNINHGPEEGSDAEVNGRPKHYDNADSEPRTEGSTTETGGFNIERDEEMDSTKSTPTQQGLCKGKKGKKISKS